MHLLVYPKTTLKKYGSLTDKKGKSLAKKTCRYKSGSIQSVILGESRIEQ
jgi:hypothetical protein